jgi:hypothetical protein
MGSSVLVRGGRGGLRLQLRGQTAETGRFLAIAREEFLNDTRCGRIQPHSCWVARSLRMHTVTMQRVGLGQ